MGGREIRYLPQNHRLVGNRVKIRIRTPISVFIITL